MSTNRERDREARPKAGDCWKGRGDPAPFVPGVPDPVPSYRSLGALFSDMACCTRCELASGRTQVVPGVGPRRAAVLILGEAPGAEEDRRGAPFVGRAGRLLDRLLANAGLEREDVFITNVVACRPPGNRTPRAAEIRAHAPWLDAQLRLVQPRLIVTLGRVALGYFIRNAKVTELRGKATTVERDGRRLTILPTLHPAAVLRAPDLLPSVEEDFGRIREVLARLED
ncbi:MAG: uracil-DNA glycosylase [bacterium]|jgi:uracil-DNA glycosylase family 4|nr:MAG: uracil-DNA glycosylase [bacterium]